MNTEIVNSDKEVFQLDKEYLKSLVESIGNSKESVIPILQAIQGKYKYLPEETLRYICEISVIKPADITGVSTFYSQFRHKPVGKHMINVCMGTACHVKGAGLVYDAFKRHLKLEEGEDTDSENKFTLSDVSCLGCCTLAPVVQIDSMTFGHVLPESVGDIIDEFLEISELEKEKDEVAQKGQAGVDGEVRVGLGSCCVAGGSDGVMKEAENAIKRIGAQVIIKSVGCTGVCHQTPLLEIIKPNGDEHMYARVNEKDVASIIDKHFKPKGVIKRIKTETSRVLKTLYNGHEWNHINKFHLKKDDEHLTAFLDNQINIATEHSGKMDPLHLSEYEALGGFNALKELIKNVDQNIVVDEILKSGLRGRGGAGFPTGKKWEIVKNAEGNEKIIICNGDEGDPGAFMDRMLLESYPYRVLEGMITAAFAVGATFGYLYIRAEYPLAVNRIESAIAQCEKHGYLGENILGSGYSLKLKVKEGAGAFVCGEETALIESIEGKRGMPQVKPPFPAIEGLWKKPTLINNAETYALVSWIIRNGSDKFGEFGTDKSKGTKVFALAGKIKRGGLIEVPMGITVRQIIEDIGGGMGSGRKLKAVQVGGPSGGCIPEKHADVSVDFENLSELGSMMGSGGMVVLDEADCMVDIARYFLSFTQKESCGKCTFCRVGTKRMLDIMNDICEGRGKKGDIEKLEQLSHQVKAGSLCGLGKTAPNPVLSTIKYFREEYEAHLEGKCPAGKCKDLIIYQINDKCTGCTLCAQKCPVDAIDSKSYKKHIIKDELCIRCDACREVCSVDAVEVV